LDLKGPREGENNEKGKDEARWGADEGRKACRHSPVECKSCFLAPDCDCSPASGSLDAVMIT